MRHFAGHSVIVLVLLGTLGCSSGSEPFEMPADLPEGSNISPQPSLTMPSATTPSLPLKGKTVVIDPGHNPNNFEHSAEINKLVDPGGGAAKKPCDTTGTASSSGYREADFTLDVSRMLARFLRERGARVVMTHDGDRAFGPCITERAAIGNREKADAAISIHADGASQGHGYAMLLPSQSLKAEITPVLKQSRDLGLAIRSAVDEQTGWPHSTYLGKDAISNRDDLGGLNLSTQPKVFIECGNMKDKGDVSKLSDERWRQRLAEAIGTGISNYLT